MTAAEHKIIIEQGSDFTLDVKVFESVGNPLDMSVVGDVWVQEFKLSYYDVTATPPAIVDATPSAITYTITDAVNGKVSMTIDKDGTNGTGSLPTRTAGFKTSFEYFYNFNISETNSGRDLRILRGKCAVRAS